jgi:REP element-mobilizing transposase RayT
MENLNFELYGQKKQELYNLINDFFPKFNGIFITTDTTKCGEELNESEITERCWKGYTQKGMKTMFGKRYPNCVKIKKKKESKEGVGGYAAPAFEMEPDHVHFKHSYNESNEKQYHMKNLKESIKNILKEEEDGNLEQRFKKSMQKLQYIFEVNISSDIDSLEISEIKFDPKFHYIEGKLTVNSYYEDHDFGGLGKHINSLEDKIFSIYKEYTFTENGGLIKRGPNYDNDWFMNCTPIGMKWGSYGSEPFIVTLEFIISQDEYDA